jgi:hypothetical protein
VVLRGVAVYLISRNILGLCLQEQIIDVVVGVAAARALAVEIVGLPDNSVTTV